MLYVCATPIGNLSDISYRAIEVLKRASIILCEDTRVARLLLNHHNVSLVGKELVVLNEHNEENIILRVLEALSANIDIVQITDAGTPSVSDPGHKLCSAVLNAKLPISPIPGPCAYIALISVCGSSTPHLFYGFLPKKSAARQTVLQKWHHVNYLVCIYESPHRIIATLNDIIAILGPDRIIVSGRAITKKFETIIKNSALWLKEHIASTPNEQLDEYTLIIMPNNIEKINYQQKLLLELLLKLLPHKDAIQATCDILGGNKSMYKQWLATL